MYLHLNIVETPLCICFQMGMLVSKMLNLLHLKLDFLFFKRSLETLKSLKEDHFHLKCLTLLNVSS